MAGLPSQQPQGPAAGRGRGMTVPAWMKVTPAGPSPPAASPTSGPLQAHIPGNTPPSGPLPPPRMPGLGPSGAPPNYGVPQMQFRPQGPPQPGQQFMPSGGQQYRPAGPPPGMGPPQHGIPPNMQGMGPQQGMPPSSQPSQYSPSPMQQMLPRPPQQPQPPQASQGPMSYPQQPRPMAGGPPPQQQPQPHGMPPPSGPGNPGMQPPSSFGFNSSLPYPQAPNSYGMTPPHYQSPMQPQSIQPMQQSNQPWPMIPGQSMPPALPQGLQATAQPPPAGASSLPGATSLSAQSSVPGPSDWQEHTAPDGRRYYHNKRTKLSSWEKPVELMTPTERADASTVWKEFTTADGRKYYYNKNTKQSKWTMPDEMKLAREQVDKSTATTTSGSSVAEVVPPSVTLGTTPTGTNPVSFLPPAASPKPSVIVNSSPVFLTPPVALPIAPPVTTVPAFTSSTPSGILPSVAALPAEALKEDSVETSMKEEAEETSAQDLEEAKKAMPLTGKINITPFVEEKPSPVAEEPLTYANKTEAKNAFKELLESVHVESDWTWDQAMRVIINDKRYGALKTLGERKQAFNEYLAQRKKLETEEKRLKQKKAREDFLAMLEESKELTSSMRWSKALTLFEEDPRLQAVEKDREREELFEDYLVDLERKREKAREERKKNLAEYRSFLESCDYIKANTQWRKVQDKLEDDERCSRLDKIDRLETFQEYIRDLEKEEEEEKKLQKEQLRRKERKNRDDFRNLMEEHKGAGTLNARTQWRDYLVKIKDRVEYQVVAANTSGSTPKELFEDFAEELDKQYHEDKVRAKEAMKAGKISVTSTWSLDKFKAAIAEAGDLEAIAEPNLKLVFDDLLERAKEKDEKEAKKKRRMLDDFTDVLRTMKQVTASSKWEECRPLLEETPEFRAFIEESSRKKVFEDYVTHLQQRAKEKDRKREKEEKAKKEKEKEKEKERERRKEKDKDKDKEREREKDKDKEKSKREKEVIHDVSETGNNHVHKEEKKKDKEREKDRDRERDKDKKYRKRHRSSSEDAGSDREDKDKEDSKRSRRHGIDHKKSSRKHGHESGSDSEAKHKRHRRDRDGTRRNGAAEELEDGELGEDGEIR
ncbi:hypothetical protein Mapa_004069 [Marchantia paleacea]|nr:hypothetical protein Mapa_004069 [Marchantia paleacea]